MSTSDTSSPIPEKFLKPYDSTATESVISDMWEKAEIFNPDTLHTPDSSKEYFSIVLPPPNVTGYLHLGHASMLTIEDIMVRFNRMRGTPTVWVPGTDHAGIATQSKVEKIIEKEGLRKTDLGREAFLARVQEFAKDSQDTILSQVRAMGASVDWSRLAYTLDEKRSHVVRTAFVRMYEQGLIYQGEQIVNWDPKGQTVISDDEVVYTEEKTQFYYLKYGPFIIGTARPETKFADKYIVVHPDDPRYKQYEHMQEFVVEWINGPITATLIKDECIDPEFGTGAMTITPWHSGTDFELAEKYKLPKEQIIDQYGKLLPIAEEFAGMKISEAREKIIEKLASKNLVEKVEENYVHNIATAERTGATIEPQIMRQWFVAVEKPFAYQFDTLPFVQKGEMITLKQLMRRAVDSQSITILPDQFEKVYYHWIDNLHDWCISRQIWFGHRIPVWYKDDETYCGENAPEGDGWTQDPDTLDTWFSSGLWTFSTLGWPNTNTSDYMRFHPTTVLETGRDILFFWVARMILMTTTLTGQIPFKTVYLQGLVTDEKGKKISKSAGNNIDPIEVIRDYGADALRMSLIIGTAPGQDSRMSFDKIRAYKKFGNKIWNITRFIVGAQTLSEDISSVTYTETHIQWLRECEELKKEVTELLTDYKFYLAGERLYHYIWHTLADLRIEESKTDIASEDIAVQKSTQKILAKLLVESIQMLHPFMPFITEDIWQSLPEHIRSLLNTDTPYLATSLWNSPN